MDNHDFMLLPPEPAAIREVSREVACRNDDCPAFEDFVEELVEVEYWSEYEARFTWTCDKCLMVNEEEFSPIEEVDWDAYYDDRRLD